MQNEQNWDITAGDDFEDLQNSYADNLQDVILFAVDCSASMVAPRRKEVKKKGASANDKEEPSELNSHLFATLRAAADLQKKKALYGPNDMVGIMLFNTMESEKTDSHGHQMKPHILAFQRIQQVNADLIQNILSILNDVSDGNTTLEQKFRPWTRRVALGDVFNACNWLLRDQAPKAATKRVFLITDEDDPNEGSTQLDRVAKQNLADLYALGVTIEPFFISTSTKPFVVTKKYLDILSRSKDTDDENAVQPIPTVIDGFSRFLEEMSIREAPKRSMFHITMTMGEGFAIGVKGFGLVVEQKKISPKMFVDVDGELKELTGKTVYFAEGSLEEQKQGQVVYGMSLSSEQTALTGSSLYPEEESATVTETRGQLVQPSQNYYTLEDVKKLRSLGLEPGIRILGFKDADTLAFEDNIKHSWFIYPSDTLYKGSICAFNALLKTLVKKNKIGLALALFRRNSPPYFYAMVPQEEILDDDGIQERPPGFHMIPLPYADDIRAAPVEEALRASDDLVQAAAAWIKKVRITKGYQPDSYPNPSLNLFYSQLEALALREEFNPDEFNDQSAPQTELMLERAGPLVENWKKVLEQDPNANVYVVKKSGTKRKADVAIDELEVRDHYASGKLSKLTVDALKGFLRSKSLSTTGKKADLLQRATEWLDKN